MKVKIGNVWYDSEKEPLMVVLSGDEKALIAQMPAAYNRFARFPASGVDREEAKAWMDAGWDGPLNDHLSAKVLRLSRMDPPEDDAGPS